jgi:hypothetical protein
MGTFAPVFSLPFIDIFLEFTTISLIFSWLLRDRLISSRFGGSSFSFPCFIGLFAWFIRCFNESSNEL